MSDQQKPPYRRRKFGKRLRKLRESAGLSMEDAAAKLDKNRTSLVRIESGHYKADVHLVRTMMDVYDKWELGLLDEAREALKPSWYSTYGLKDMGYVDVEQEAAQVSEYACQVVPGLLQTEDYVRAVIEGSRRRRTRKQLDSEVSVRLIRQERLTSEDDPLELVAIIDEAALHREVGGSELMRSQVRHLIEVAELPTVTLQVLPFGVGAHSAMDGAFTVLDFPDPKEQPLLYQAYVSGALQIEDREEVREAKLAFDALRSEALSPADSVALIERMHRQP